MKIYLGETGLDQSWQNPFPKTTECHKCKGEARIMFVGQEGKEKKFISELHEEKGRGGFWFHDAIAVAMYLCKECFEPTAIVNQA
ncbi:MAG TPA: hypothetical protein ENH85_03380 [Candidatus Scalindua sp.]|nr:hypothetical protein [Candidatus Scalindua sp.]